MLDFEQPFYSNCNITNGTCKGMGGWEGAGGGGGGWEAEGELRLPLKRQTAVLCVQ